MHPISWKAWQPLNDALSVRKSSSITKFQSPGVNRRFKLKHNAIEFEFKVMHHGVESLLTSCGSGLNYSVSNRPLSFIYGSMFEIVLWRKYR